MKLIIPVLALFAMCFAPPAFARDSECSASARSVPVCDVLADAAKYDGRETTVKGLYRMVIHGSILTGSACSKAEVNMRQAPGHKADKHASAVLRSLTKKNKFETVDVVLRGTFRVAHQGQCFGQICSSYEIEETELLCASPLKTGNSSNAKSPDDGTGTFRPPMGTTTTH